ncbi:hypothetical protein O181_051667 [Austropuccinia psidii MF-1]|uniref:Uncharacterized protein n=1 Tax=Austropuccinia psidii MF-1 TaxID=1389203 RepID=A0A9Q3E644_9BASI|nr:hypothetical protein [Austropuccinia psidii MF-1]
MTWSCGEGFPNTKDNHCLRPVSIPPVVNPILTPTQYHAHYPIITPPTQLPFQDLQQPISNATRQQRLADLYRPRYPQQTPMVMKAKFTEIDPDKSAVDEVTVDDMAPPGDRCSVCDTGASHSLNGHLSSVFYPGYRGKHVVINGLFYSPDATGTLISPGALLNTGALLEFIGDDILISTRGEGPVLCANYSASRCKWEWPLYGRLLAHAINTSYSPTISPAESIETINIPTFSKMTLDAINKKISHPKQKMNTYPLAFKAKFLKWHCLFGQTGLRRIHHLHSLNRSPTPLEIFIADLMGPFDVATINGRRYALNVCDVALTYGECHILKNKSNATSWLEEIINRWQ